MILGTNCTRDCAFCNVSHEHPDSVDLDEPRRIAQAVAELKLSYVVVTSVTRDDLPDGGAEHFALTIQAIRRYNSETIVEVLIPDFLGSSTALATVMDAQPDIVNHNIETVAELYAAVRPSARYGRSLELLQRVAESGQAVAKSGFMLGLGETQDQVTRLLHDLRNTGCQALAIGQYLSPSQRHYPVAEYVHPSVFEDYKEQALSLGFAHVASGPLVRSSYHADEIRSILFPCMEESEGSL